MKKSKIAEILKALPLPEDLKGHMPEMKASGMLKALLESDTKKIAHITLIAVLMGTVRALMEEHKDWDDFIDPSNISSDDELKEEEVPEPCGDPECEGCAELEKALAHAKKHGGVIKAIRLTKKQAREMGLIDDDGNDIKKGIAGHCKSEDETSDGKVIH